MTDRLKCTTLFDITATGTRGNYRQAQIPAQDSNGAEITTLDAWHRSRNQQRNWETINQLISLRTLPENITNPTHNTGVKTWSFEFEIPTVAAFDNGRLLGALLDDCNNVPMILGLDEGENLDPVLVPEGPDCNIWFEVLPLNKAEE